MHVHDIVHVACVLAYLATVLPIVTGRGHTESGLARDSASMRLAAVALVSGDMSELCEKARLQCTMRTGCQMALNNFFLGCNSVIMGEEARCTTACKHALVSLLATEDGAGLAFINCNCSGHEQCEERKQRVQVCQRHVLDSMDLVRDDNASVSCSFARWICEADTSCLAALQYYIHHCAKLFHGTKCTSRCRNSVHILYRQPNARKLRTCRCEGTEDYDCQSLVANTEKLCFSRGNRHGQGHLNDFDFDYTHEEDDDRSGSDMDIVSENSQRQVAGMATEAVRTSGMPKPSARRRKRRNRPKNRKNGQNATVSPVKSDRGKKNQKAKRPKAPRSQGPKSTGGQTSKPTEGQTSKPTGGQTSKPARGQTSKPTGEQTSKPARGKSRTRKHQSTTKAAP